MLLWDGSGVVHEAFKADALEGLMKRYPDAGVLVHPESPGGIIAMADVVGSTSKMKQVAGDKLLLEAPVAGEGLVVRAVHIVRGWR